MEDNLGLDMQRRIFQAKSQIQAKTKCEHERGRVVGDEVVNTDRGQIMNSLAFVTRGFELFSTGSKRAIKGERSIIRSLSQKTCPGNSKKELELRLLHWGLGELVRPALGHTLHNKVVEVLKENIQKFNH